MLNHDRNVLVWLNRIRIVPLVEVLFAVVQPLTGEPFRNSCETLIGLDWLHPERIVEAMGADGGGFDLGESTTPAAAGAGVERVGLRCHFDELQE